MGEEQAAAGGAAFDAWWEALPETEWEALIKQAKAGLLASGPLAAQHYQRNPEGLSAALRPVPMRLSGR